MTTATKTWNPWKSVVTCRETWLSHDDNVFMVQIAVSAFFTTTTNFILRRFGFSSFFSNMIGAIIIGPSVLSHFEFFKEFAFPYRSLHVLEIGHYLGNMLFPFLVGLKMDFQMMNGSRPASLVIGISVGLIPFLLSFITSLFWRSLYFSTNLKKGLMLASASLSSSQISFHDVVCLLADLKILNSKVGRLAIASSMISNLIGLSVLTVMSSAIKSKYTLKPFLKSLGSILSLVIFIVYVLRPVMDWMIRQIPRGKNNVKDIHVFVVFFLVLCCSLLGQCLGHSPGMGPMFLGLVLPAGPPLAETIESKLETIVAYVFLPLFYCACSGRIAIGGNDTDLRQLMFVALIIFESFFGKIITAVLSSIYCGLSLNDALVLALILASPGTMILIYFNSSLRYTHIDAKVYGVLIYFSVGIAGLTSILVKVTYRPSRDYLSYNKITLRDSINETKFRILACIYQDYNVPSILDLLEASNPTKESPIRLYLLHLIELQRIAPPLLIPHKSNEVHSIYYDRSKQIIKAFRYFEKQLKERVSLKAFSALSPCESMQQDICSLAMEKSTSLIILPFHRQLNFDGMMEEMTTIRNVNTRVLNISPCSIGILVDRRCRNDSNLLVQSNGFFHVAIIFLGGADDREVLTYGMHMAENPSTYLTVIQFSVAGDTNNNLRRADMLDVELLDDFRQKYRSMERITYMEEEVSDNVGISKTMREIEDKFNLLMVGRQHEESKIFEGLSEWREYPELGYMGDMLATCKYLDDVPILVLQQNFQCSKKHKLHV